MQSARRLLHYLSKNKRSLSPLLILTHDYPDPDTLASAFAFAHLAERRFGITCKIVYGGIIGRMENRNMVRILKVPAHKMKSSHFRKYSNVALMDTQPSFQNNSLPKNKPVKIVIDQHPFVKRPVADCVIVDVECGATSVILGQALLQSHLKIPAAVATALVYGILSDTLNLYRASRPDIVQTYLRLLPHCDLRSLARIQNPSRSRRFFFSLRKAIQNAMVRRRLIGVHLEEVENPDLVAQVADFLLTYKNMQWSFCSGRYKGKLHVSFRTANTAVDAGEILRDVFVRRGEAGGHDGIAGGSFKVGNVRQTEWKKTEQELVHRLMKRLRIPVRGDFYFPFR